MKFLVAILFSAIISLHCGAQDYGAQWILSYNTSVLDFRNDTLINYPIAPFMPMLSTNADICDSNGSLLYYTNGVYVAGADGNQIANGNNLSPCNYTSQNVCCGLDIPQGALFLPMPGNSRYYYLFHMSDDSLSDTRPGTLYYSIIDVQGNSGKGAITSKNITFYKGLFRDGGMTACKHANGRDWWIIMGNRYNTYYKFLLTPNGIGDTLMQTIGPSFHNPSDIAYSKFSQDGTKYITSCNEGYVLVMDFDRCSGGFSNPLDIYNNGSSDPIHFPATGAASVELSPNGRFVYATNTVALNQFDLWSSNPQSDSVMIYEADSNDHAQMYALQIAPNGKLYASCFAGGFGFLHVVNNPDGKGDSCMYVDTGYVTLTENTITLPNMINYKLGALIGSGCDTITSAEQLQASCHIRIMPNPADKYLYVEMGMQGNYEFDLLNTNGQVLDRKETRQVDIFDTEHLASGVYFLKVIDKINANKTVSQKLVVQH